ncbi:MAG: hypothetical protein M3384_11915 [Acidobacteriota bacterium]|nr:hypothetical protein [Acidobacteriota bacterium]
MRNPAHLKRRRQQQQGQQKTKTTAFVLEFDKLFEVAKETNFFASADVWRCRRGRVDFLLTRVFRKYRINYRSSIPQSFE